MGWSPLQFDMRILLCSPHNALNSNAQSLGHVLDRAVIAKNLMPEFKSGLSPKRESCRQIEKQIRCGVIFPFLFVVVAALLQRSDQMLQCSIDHVFPMHCMLCWFRCCCLAGPQNDTCGIRTHAGRPHQLSRPTP